MNSRVRLGLVVAVTGLVFAILALFFWDFVRDTIVVPIYYLLWFSDLLLKSLPQEAYLALLVIVCLFMGLNILQKAQNKPAPRSQRPPPMDSDSRYVFWARHYNNLYSSPFFRNKFATETRKFILTVLSFQEDTPVSEVERMIVDGELPVPGAVRDLIQHKEIRGHQRVSGHIGWFSRLFGHTATRHDPHIEQQVAEIIAFIDRRLEIRHAGNDFAN